MRMCGDHYVDGPSANWCCWDLINQCFSKAECQANNDSYLQISIVAGYCFIGLSALYSVAYITYQLVTLLKACFRPQRQERMF